MMLPILLLIPLIGAAVGAFMPARLAKTWALVISLVAFLHSLGMMFQFDYAASGFQFVFQGASVNSVGVKLSFGVDAISLWLTILTTLLSVLAIAASFESIRDRATEYYAWMQLLLAAMLGVFVSRDLLLFYVFFELTLVPMFFIIGIWGGPERRFAAGKFFLFTFTGSVFTLAAAIYLGVKYGTFDIGAIVQAARHGKALADMTWAAPLTPTERNWIVLGFLAGFAV